MVYGPINVVVSRLVGVDLPFVVTLSRSADNVPILVMGGHGIIGQGYTEPNAIADFVNQVNEKLSEATLLVSNVRVIDRVTVGLKGMESC